MAGQSPEGLAMGKVPPQALDLEEAVLGAMMLEKNAVNEAIDILKPDSFYSEKHGKIFSAVLRLFEEGKPYKPRRN